MTTLKDFKRDYEAALMAYEFKQITPNSDAKVLTRLFSTF